MCLIPSRNDKTVDFIQLFRFFHQNYLRAQFFQPAAMRVEIALERENPDLHPIHTFHCSGTRIRTSF